MNNEEILKRIIFFETLFDNGKIETKSGLEILEFSNKFKKIEKEYVEKHSDKIIKKKIAVLASFTTIHLLNVLKLIFLQKNIYIEFYEGLYNNITAELLDENSNLYKFKPDLIYIFTYHTDLKQFPELFSMDNEVIQWAEEKTKEILNLFEIVFKRFNCQIFYSLYVQPIYRQLGNLEKNYFFSESNCINLINLELIKKRPSYVSYIDLEYYASLSGKNKWFDDKNYFLSKQGFSFDSMVKIGNGLSRLMEAFIGRQKKCLVIDLDNTLWGGIIGDDGLTGIKIDPNDPIGEAFIFFQKYLKKLKERGVLLAICSKNDETTAKIPFQEHRDMILKLDDISCFVANWQDKAANIKYISKSLNIGLDAIVFFDDNPAERELIKQFLPEVEVIEVPEDPAYYTRSLEISQCFEWLQISREDLVRTDTFKADVKREELKNGSVNYENYLQSLEMKAEIGYAGQNEINRFTQLINKSNQFNLRTKRYSEADIISMQNNPSEFVLYYIRFSDKFSNYGIISSIILRKYREVLFIDTLVMSCRALKRGLENLIYNLLIETAKKFNFPNLAGEYIETSKNHIVKELLPELGFLEDSKNEYLKNYEGQAYFLPVKFAKEKQHNIKVSAGGII